jgi:hypothetical protein
MSASLIDWVRERLVAESGPLRQNVVAAAISGAAAPNPAVCSATARS